MIYIDSQRCDGCGICLDTCPTGAIVLRDNIAFIEQDLCEECQVCLDKCPRGAILLSEAFDVAEARPLSTVPASKVEILPPAPKAKPVATSLGASVGAAIVEVLPRLASLVVDWLERRPRSIETSTQDANQISSPDRTTQRGTGRGQGQGKGRGQGRGRGQGGGRGSGRGKRQQQRSNRR